MAKVRCHWKDPDYIEQEDLIKAFDLKRDPNSDSKNSWEYIPQSEWDRAYNALHVAGIEEYITVEFDTETGEAKIIGRKKK